MQIIYNILHITFLFMRVFMTVFITALFDPEEDWRTGKYAFICNESTLVLIALYQVASHQPLNMDYSPSGTFMNFRQCVNH